jgi:hypothetical protein
VLAGRNGLGCLEQDSSSITPGKQADIVLLRTDTLNMTPMHDEVQRAAFEELKTAVAKAVDLLKAACPTVGAVAFSATLRSATFIALPAAAFSVDGNSVPRQAICSPGAG